MTKKRELLAAGIVRDIRFPNMAACDKYYDSLIERKATFKVLETYEQRDGVVIMRIVQQYNDSPLIQLYEEG